MGAEDGADVVDELDAGRIAAWLATDVDPSVSSVRVRKLDGGHSSGAWRLDADGASGRGGAPMVLKAPALPSVVFRRDAAREARIIDALGRSGAPVPAVLGIDATGTVVGRPCFAMAHVDARSVPDSALEGYYGEGWFRDAGADGQRAIWDAFHDALAALHRVDPADVPDASLGPNGLVDVLGYWRASLLDAAPPEHVPRQLALLDRLEAGLPPDADASPAVCMGDARLANALIGDTEVRALVDFEVAYVGNPAADVGYSLFFDRLQRGSADGSVRGIPAEDETWARWSGATGRVVADRDYWMAFGATILCITATRAMIQWGLSEATVESDNPIVGMWEAAMDTAAP